MGGRGGPGPRNPALRNGEPECEDNECVTVVAS